MQGTTTRVWPGQGSRMERYFGVPRRRPAAVYILAKLVGMFFGGNKSVKMRVGVEVLS